MIILDFNLQRGYIVSGLQKKREKGEYLAVFVEQPADGMFQNKTAVQENFVAAKE